jgi:hypothetical protein
VARNTKQTNKKKGIVDVDVVRIHGRERIIEPSVL